MDSPTSKVDAGVLLPGGIGTSEASLILHLYAELKLRRPWWCSTSLARLSALDDEEIARSRPVGATSVFSRQGSGGPNRGVDPGAPTGVPHAKRNVAPADSEVLQFTQRAASGVAPEQDEPPTGQDGTPATSAA